MKKLILLAMLLGLSGCGDNNQSDTQTNTQTSTLQKAEAEPAVASYSLAAAPRTFGAVAPLAGWSVTNSTVVGASTLIDAIKDTRVSAALVTPNAKQVAEVLRGGAAGIALGIAVEQLLGAVDWVLDPANNQIRYKPITCNVISECSPLYEFFWTRNPFTSALFAQPESVCELIGIQRNQTVIRLDRTYNNGVPSVMCRMKTSSGGRDQWGLTRVRSTIYDPSKQEETLPLETVAEQVISNADSGSLDAQVATNLAAQNILNDVIQAEPVVQDLENNAQEKCDPNTNQNCRQECEPPAGVKFNKVTHFERHGRDPDINKGSHGCMAITGSPVHWHFSVNHQLPDGRCFLEKHAFGGCGVAP